MTDTEGKTVVGSRINHAPERFIYNHCVLGMLKTKHRSVVVRNKSVNLLSNPQACKLYVAGGNHASV